MWVAIVRKRMVQWVKTMQKKTHSSIHASELHHHVDKILPVLALGDELRRPHVGNGHVVVVQHVSSTLTHANGWDV